jgi:hypothetical protein
MRSTPYSSENSNIYGIRQRYSTCPARRRDSVIDATLAWRVCNIEQTPSGVVDLGGYRVNLTKEQLDKAPNHTKSTDWKWNHDNDRRSSLN